MKLRFRCPECNPTSFYLYAPTISIELNMNINENFIYHATCKNGHNISFVIQDPAYEILLVQAFHFLNIREWNASVIFFRIAHESFLKHTNIMLFYYNYMLENDSPAQPDGLNEKESIQYGINYHKKILGLFKQDKIPNTEEKKSLYSSKSCPKRMKDIDYFHYIFKKTFGEEPPVVENTIRNNIIHEGYFYSEEEALHYCETLYNHIREILIYLEHFPKSLAKDLPDELQYNLLCAAHSLNTIYSQQNDLDSFITQKHLTQEITGIYTNNSIPKRNFYDFFEFLKEFTFDNFDFHANK